jgi:uncharacterized protein (TIGR03435 family)
MQLRKFTYYLVTAMLLIPAGRAQKQAAAARPQFEVASLKLNIGCRFEGGSIFPSPGRLELPCFTLQFFIQYAYGIFANGVSANVQPLKMEGVPDWAQSDLYSLVAKAEGPASLPVLAGPMLRTLLEQRFQLKTHWVTREMPVYVLTLGKGGLKTRQLPEGACTVIDRSRPKPPVTPGEPLPKYCGATIMSSRRDGTELMEVRGVTVEQFAERLSGPAGRPVVDRTGIKGMYTFHLEYAPDRAARRVPDGDAGPTPQPIDRAPALLDGLQEQTGLKVTSEKGAVEVLVIDHVERPSAN